MRQLAIRIAVIALICHLYSAHVFAVEPVPQGIASAERDRLIEEKVEKAQKELEAILKDRIDARTSTALDGRFEAAAGRLEKQAEERFTVVNNHYDSMNKLFSDAIGYFKSLIAWAGLVIGVLISVASFLIWKKDRNLNDVIEKRIEDAKNRVNDRIADMGREVKKSHDSLAFGLERFDAMKSNYEQALKENAYLREQLESLTAFKHKRVLWCYETMDIDVHEEIMEIRKEGFKVSISKPGEETDLNPKNYDFLIYAFSKSDQSEARLQQVVDFLERAGRKIPLIVYTFNNGEPAKLDREFGVLGKYRHYVPANTPLTLKSHFNSLIRLDSEGGSPKS